jgi:predicted dehydrogenase
MRFIAGDPQWCFARVTQGGKPATRSDVREGGEQIGKITGDTITAMFGFTGPLVGHFGSHPAKQGRGARFGTHVYGTKGAISIGQGAMPPVHILEDPAWTLNGGKWVPISSAGVGADEPIKESSLRFGNGFIARDLIRCVEENRRPLGSVYDGRAALEMILAVYASHFWGKAVEFPLKEREHVFGRLDS